MHRSLGGKRKLDDSGRPDGPKSEENAIFVADYVIGLPSEKWEKGVFGKGFGDFFAVFRPKSVPFVVAKRFFGIFLRYFMLVSRFSRM